MLTLEANKLVVEAVDAKKFVVVAFVIVALSEVRLSTDKRFAYNVLRTFRNEIEDVEIVVVPRVVVAAVNSPAFVIADVRLVVEIFVEVEFVIVPFVEEIFVLVIFVLVIFVAVTFVETTFVEVELVIVAFVVCKLVAFTFVPFASVNAKFVVVAFVIVALSAVNPNTFNTLAQRVASTFRLEIDEVEIVVVPNVVVAAVRELVAEIFPAVTEGAVSPEIFSDPIVAVAIVVVANEELPVEFRSFAFVVPETERFVEVELVTVAFARTAVPPAMFAVVRFAFVEAKFVVVAFVIVASVPVSDVNTALTAFNIDAKKFVEVAAVNVAEPFAIVAFEIFAFVVAKLVVVAFVIVAFVPVRFVITAVNAFKIVAKKFVDVELVTVASERIAVPELIVATEIVVVARVVVAADNVLVAVIFPAVIEGAERFEIFRLAIVAVAIVVVARFVFPVEVISFTFVVPETAMFVEVELVTVAFERIAVPPAIVALDIFAFVEAKLVVVAFVIVALSEVRFRMLATVANRFERTFNQVIVEVEIVVVANVAVPETKEPTVASPETFAEPTTCKLSFVEVADAPISTWLVVVARRTPPLLKYWKSGPADANPNALPLK
jgi:hypothetical protein